MSTDLDSIELPKLPENQKSFAGIPEAVFVVSASAIYNNITSFTGLTWIREGRHREQSSIDQPAE